MRRLHATFARRAHDVIEHRRQFEDLESALAQITISSDVTVAEPKHVPELMRERAPREIAWSESHISAHQTMCSLRASSEHRTVFGKFRRMRSDVDTLSAFSNLRHFADLELQPVGYIAIVNLPKLLDSSFCLRKKLVVLNIRVHRHNNDHVIRFRTINLDERR